MDLARLSRVTESEVDLDVRKMNAKRSLSSDGAYVTMEAGRGPSTEW